RRLAVAAAREGGAAGALERDVAPKSGAIDQFAEEQGTPVAELRREASELVAGIGLGDGLRVDGHEVAREDRGAPVAAPPGRVEAQLHGELLVEEEQSRRGHLRRLPGHEGPGQLARVGVVEAE